MADSPTGMSGETLQEALEHDARQRESLVTPPQGAPWKAARTPLELMEECVAALKEATAQTAEFAALAASADLQREEKQAAHRLDDIRVSVAMSIYTKRCTENPAASRQTLAESAFTDADAFLKAMANK